MAYRDLLLAPVDTVPTPEYSMVESERFGLKTSRVHAGPQTRCTGSDLARAIRAHDVDLVILRYPAERVDWYAALVQESGYEVLFAESMLLQSLALPAPIPASQLDAGEIEIIPLDASTSSGSAWEAVDAIVGESFTGYSTHYRANPHLPEVSFAAVYSEWLRTMVSTPGNAVNLWLSGGEPGGFIGYEIYDAPDGVRTGEIHIIGTRQDLQGNHESTLAFLDVQDRMADEGVTRSVTVVQTHNFRPITGLQRLGYRPLLLVATAHLVHPRVLGADR